MEKTFAAAMIRSTMWDLGLPALTYYGLHFAGASDTAALLAGTGVAGVRLAWGFGLLAEALVRVVLVYALPVSVMVGLSTVLTVITFGSLLVWNARYVAARTREGHALAA